MHWDQYPTPTLTRSGPRGSNPESGVLTRHGTRRLQEGYFTPGNPTRRPCEVEDLALSTGIKHLLNKRQMRSLLLSMNGVVESVPKQKRCLS